MPTSNLPVLELLLPPEGHTWLELPPTQQAIWHQWSFGNATSWLDFRKQYRTAQTNYTNAAGAWSKLNPLPAVLQFPMSPAFFSRGYIAPVDTLVDETPNWTTSLTIPTISQTVWFNWATPLRNQSAPPDQVVYHFKGCNVMPAGGFGEEPHYSAIEGNAPWTAELTGQGGKTFDWFIFGYSQGQLEFVGGRTVFIQDA
jgi:hypothetical protein